MTIEYTHPEFLKKMLDKKEAELTAKTSAPEPFHHIATNLLSPESWERDQRSFLERLARKLPNLCSIDVVSAQRLINEISQRKSINHVDAASFNQQIAALEKKR